MTDAELVAELRRLHESVGAVAYRDDGFVSLFRPDSRPARTILSAAADRLDALAIQLVGEEKARHLLLKGMESQCELMDGLKQEARKLAAELDAAVARAAELEAGLKPFVSAQPDPADNMLYAVYVTGAALRRAAELLAGEGGGR